MFLNKQGVPLVKHTVLPGYQKKKKKKVKKEQGLKCVLLEKQKVYS